MFLPPARFSVSDIPGLKWRMDGGRKEFWRHVIAVTDRFPSVILAHAAFPGSQDLAGQLAEELAKTGINVFLPDEAVPMSALSLAVTSRCMPLGLYLSEGPNGLLELSGIGGQGGPLDLRDLPDFPPDDPARIGVVGQTEILTAYVQQVQAFIEPDPAASPGLKDLVIPFPRLEQALRESAAFSHLWRKNGDLRAAISPDGQSLKLSGKPGANWTTEQMVKTIAGYLIGERCADGTILGPEERLHISSTWGSGQGVTGSSLAMSYQAGFTDLLVGWWEPGILAHQGHGPFGDGLLTLLYLLEAHAAEKTA